MVSTGFEESGEACLYDAVSLYHSSKLSPENRKEGLMEKFMRRAIELAKRGEGYCHPNPLVGAVIVRDGRIIGEGYHARYGDLHAERNALKSLTESAQGATLYCTLEPCCHTGKQPPCTEAIIESGISKVVVGSDDPNKLVAGKGFEILKNAGIEVVRGFLKEECDALNEIFFHYISKKTPYVIMKYAMTADGKIATESGKSKWITNERSREEVHRLRHRCMGIMVGIGTVLADDPMLDCRLENGKNPIRIIADSSLKMPLDSNICRTAKNQKTIVVSAMENDDSDKRRQLEAMNIEVINCYNPLEAGVDLRMLMRELGDRKIDSIVLEGGGILNSSALRSGIVNEVRAFIGAKIFAGKGKFPIEGHGVSEVEEAYMLSLKGVERFGDDIMLSFKTKEHEYLEEESQCSQE